MSRRAWLLLASALISALLCALVLRGVDARALATALGAADGLRLGAAALLALAVNVPLSAFALTWALRSHGAALPLGSATRATLGHLALHAGAGFVVGKGARALHLTRSQGVDGKAALAAEVSLLALKAVALLALAGTGALLEGALWALPLALLVGLGVLRWRGGKLGALVTSFAGALAMGLGQVAVFLLALSALGAALPFGRVLELFPLCLLGAKAPVALMGLGLREALVLAAFRGSAPTETLLLASLLFSLTEQVLPGLLGLVFAPRFLGKTLHL